MLKVQFASGPWKLPGWENHDRDIDISKPLPFKDSMVDFVFIEHGIEHINQQDVLSFLKECKRILKVGGVIRVAFPDLTKIRFKDDKKYNDKFGEGNLIKAMTKAATGWGHQSFFNFDLMCDACIMAGLTPTDRNYPCGVSEIPELNGIEQHWRTSSKELVEIETSTVEAKKCPL